MSFLHIRDASAGDAGPIARLHAESWRSAYRGIISSAFLSGPVDRERLEAWTSRLAAESSSEKVLVAEAGQQLLGFVCAIGAEDGRWGTLVDNLHVRTASKGGGVGQALLRAIAEWSLRAHPEVGLHLWSFEQNAPANSFYEHVGGTIVERTMHESPGGGLSPCLHFHWPKPQSLLGSGSLAKHQQGGTPSTRAIPAGG